MERKGEVNIFLSGMFMSEHLHDFQDRRIDKNLFIKLIKIPDF